MLVALSIACVVVAIGAIGFWWLMQQPLYRPGMARALVELEQGSRPPTAIDANPWPIEPGIALWHFAEGSGRAVLVVHGGPGMPFRQPMKGLDPLTARYRFHYYDQRGCGRSTRPFERFADSSFNKNFRPLERTLGLGAQIADIERIRRLLGEERLMIVGHSFGALLASLYAAEFPEHTAGLLLIAPADLLVMPPPGGGLFAEMEKLLPQAMQADYKAFIADYLDFRRLFERTEAQTAALNGRFAQFYIEAARTSGHSIRVDPEVEGGGFMVQAQYLSMGQRHDYRPVLGKVTAPVLIIHGGKDMQSESVSRGYAKAFAHARVEVIESAGHMSFEEAPGRFAEIAGPFLDGIR